METKPPPYDFLSSRSRQDSVRDLVSKDITGVLPPKRTLGTSSHPVLAVPTPGEIKTIAGYCVVQADLFMAQLLKRREAGANK